MPTTGRSRLLLGLAVLAAAAGLFLAVRALSSPPPPPQAVAPSTSPSASASPSAAPTSRAIAQPKLFKVRIRAVRGEAMDSSNMYGRRPDVRVKNIRLSVRRATRSLERYLNTQFVAPRTRQTARPIRTLLSGAAQKQLTPRDRRALGMGRPRIEGGRTIAANTTAVALYEGTATYAVTLRYTARMIVDLANGEKQRLAQSGTMVLRPTGGGPWRADMVDVSLALRPAAQKKPAPRPTAAGSEGATP
jgi:hypothetical protein